MDDAVPRLRAHMVKSEKCWTWRRGLFAEEGEGASAPWVLHMQLSAVPGATAAAAGAAAERQCAAGGAPGAAVRSRPLEKRDCFLFWFQKKKRETLRSFFVILGEVCGNPWGRCGGWRFADLSVFGDAAESQVTELKRVI